MNGKVFIDTNILEYASLQDDAGNCSPLITEDLHSAQKLERFLVVHNPILQ